MADPLNANPTILNAADLPSRRRRGDSGKFSEASSDLFTSVAPSSTYPNDLFSINARPYLDSETDDDALVDRIDEQEIYDLIATISDPEHPLSLGSLAVVNLPDIHIAPPSSPTSQICTVLVEVTPTITHCSLATVIGLGVRVRLEQALPPRFRVDVRIKEGTHSTGDQVNKQLGDKERVAAALENGTLMGVLKKMLETCE
ncbi:MAG: hypothetical protein M1827_004696 [Pycnora praestabilis]|nr:MAG: hypothetical protein M1827_004696 [Pycnora praestabilis]